MWCSAMPSRCERVDQLERRVSSAATNGAISVSCEPMWKSIADDAGGWRDARAVPVEPERVLERRRRTCSPCSPVEMYGCVFGSTSGFTRNETGARCAGSAATRSMRSSSLPDSTLKQRMPAASAWRISACALADAGEHDLARIAAGGDDARELAAGDDVEAGAEPREHVEDREVRVRLHRVAHQVVASGERGRERAERASSAARE